MTLEAAPSSKKIAILDVGIGNHASVANMIRHVGGRPRIVRSPDEVQESKAILPGVGSFDKGVSGLEAAGWPTFLREFVEEGDLLGICLGMQLLGLGSEEGSMAGLGLIPMKAVRFDSSDLRVPHMGWNDVTVRRTDTLFPDLDSAQRFYFAHSFRAQCDDSAVVATASYGSEFTCVARHGRAVGVQFHPEKSHRYGMALLRRFVEA